MLYEICSFHTYVFFCSFGDPFGKPFVFVLVIASFFLTVITQGTTFSCDCPHSSHGEFFGRISFCSLERYGLFASILYVFGWLAWCISISVFWFFACCDGSVYFLKNQFLDRKTVVWNCSDYSCCCGFCVWILECSKSENYRSDGSFEKSASKLEREEGGSNF